MTSDQAFEILGITDKNIDEASLKKAFREAARYYHPDSNPGDDFASDRFNLINEAYDVLIEYIKYEDRLRQEKIKREESAKRVYRAKKTGSTKEGARAWEQPKNAQNKQTGKDRWDYYAEADKQYRKEKKEQARKEAEESIRKREKLEELHRAYEEWEKKREKASEEESSDKYSRIKDLFNKYIRERIGLIIAILIILELIITVIRLI